MNPSVLALVLYAAWTLTLLCGIALLRTYVSATGQRAPNNFAPGGDDVSAFSARLCRAHANCYENLPVFAALITAALFAGHAQITDGLALWAVAARVAQSSVHMVSTNTPAVLLRFVLMLAQVAIEACWAISLIGALL
jgi:uncharacterized MAPEG superfamily protein